MQAGEVWQTDGGFKAPMAMSKWMGQFSKTKVQKVLKGAQLYLNMQAGEAPGSVYDSEFLLWSG